VNYELMGFGRERSLYQDITKAFSGGTEKNHEKLQSG
jgi:hypothetical protein